MYLENRLKEVGESALILVFSVTPGSSKTEHPNSHCSLILATGFCLPENKQKHYPENDVSTVFPLF